MSQQDLHAVLRRALDISRQLAGSADCGDVTLTVNLDAERQQLLESARLSSQPVDDVARDMLREIARLNDKALGSMEHHLRGKARAMDMAVVGRRAVAAYSMTREQR